MNYFELLSSNKESVINKGKEEIIKALHDYIGISEKTASDWLDNFTNLMVEMSSHNPAFTALCPYRSDISEKMEYVCRKMAQFILSEKYATIIYDTYSRDHKISCTNYYYEVPLLFMPILISFIDEIRKKRDDKKDIALFFKNVDKSLRKHPFFEEISKSYPIQNKESFIDVCMSWMNTYLGRNYFIHFEELLNECAKSPQQEAILKKALGKLSDMAVPNKRDIKISSNQDMEKLDQLLLAYKNELKNEMKMKDLKSLYEPQQPYYINGEKYFINEICLQFNNTMKLLFPEIKTFIKQEHNLNSLYIIAINNLEKLDAFEQYITKFINDTESKIKESIENYYARFEQPTDYGDKLLQKAYKTKQLSLNKENNEFKMKRLSRIFQDSLNDIANCMTTFYKDIRDASGNNGSDSSADRTEEHFKKIWIIDKIKAILERTIKTINRENLWENFPTLYRYDPYVYYLSYIFSPPNDNTKDIE